MSECGSGACEHYSDTGLAELLREHLEAAKLCSSILRKRGYSVTMHLQSADGSMSEQDASSPEIRKVVIL